MATLKQEMLYNEISEYYSYADSLIRVIETSSREVSEEEFFIVEQLTTCLEKCADKLASQYIEFIKNGESEEITESVRKNLNEIATKIEECRSKIVTITKKANNS